MYVFALNKCYHFKLSQKVKFLEVLDKNGGRLWQL